MAYYQMPISMPFGDYATEPHRWIDLKNPYLGFASARRRGCLEVNDPNPKVGEIGIGLRYEVGEGADEWSCEWKVTRPNGTVHWYQGTIEDTVAILMPDDSVFTEGGAYGIQAVLYRNGRQWPQDCVSVYCVC